MPRIKESGYNCQHIRWAGEEKGWDVTVAESFDYSSVCGTTSALHILGGRGKTHGKKLVTVPEATAYIY